jgi:hypothetical protein
MSISIVARFRVLRLKTVVLFGAGVAFFGVAASAQNVHLQPPDSSPFFTDNGLTLTASGALAGLGAEDIVVNLSATANVTTTCTDRSGRHRLPPRNPAPLSVSGTQVEDKNGNATFTVTTNPPTTPISGGRECDNVPTRGSGADQLRPGDGRVAITDLSFTSATITVQQGEPPATVLTVSCTFNPPTSDGAVPTQTVSCSSQ